MLLSGNVLEQGPAAITSQLLSLQGPGTPAITSVPNVFGECLLWACLQPT